MIKILASAKHVIYHAITHVGKLCLVQSPDQNLEAMSNINDVLTRMFAEAMKHVDEQTKRAYVAELLGVSEDELQQLREQRASQGEAPQPAPPAPAGMLHTNIEEAGKQNITLSGPLANL